MQPWRKREWVRVLTVLDLRWRSRPRLSPAAPSRVSRTTAKALSSSRRSRRCGSAMRTAERPMPKRRFLTQVLDVAEAGLHRPAPGIQGDEITGRRLTVAGCQTPGFLHVGGGHADDRADRNPVGGDPGRPQFACPPAPADPGGSGVGLAPVGGDVDVAAQADDVAEAEIL